MTYNDQLHFQKTFSGNVVVATHQPTGERLSEIPAKILHHLVSNIGNHMDKDVLCKNIWGESDYFIHRTFDVYLRKVRIFLEKTNADIEIPRSSRGTIHVVRKE